MWPIKFAHCFKRLYLIEHFNNWDYNFFFFEGIVDNQGRSIHGAAPPHRS